MLRMDLLLNPRSPPPSPIQDKLPEGRVGTIELADHSGHNQASAPHIVAHVEQKSIQPEYSSTKKIILPSEIILPSSNQRVTRMLDNQSFESPPADVAPPPVKRVKRDLPGVRLLLECIDNQRDDATDERPGIFSGRAFWGKVPSLNEPSVSPTDVTATAAIATAAITRAPRPASFMAELATPLPIVITSSPVEEAEQEDEDSSVANSSGAGAKKKKVTVCEQPGCKSQALSKHLCMKHGGGPRCSFPDCNNGAKLKNLCFQHGGSTTCLAPNCSSKAKRFGYCWSHGGGRICGEEGCTKVAAQGGMCWGHGGGNRCKLPGCTKRSYKQHDYYCKRHTGEAVVADY